MPSTPTGRTGYPKWNAAVDTPDGAAQDEALGLHFDTLIGETKPTVADLPLTGNWPNRTILTLDTLGLWIWTGTAWGYAGGPEVAGTFTYDGLYKNHASYDSMTLTRRGKRVRLRGTATINGTVVFSAATNYVLGAVPAGFRPAATAKPFRSAGVSPINTAFVTVLETGNVEFALLAGTTLGANGFLLGIDLEWMVP